MKKIFLFSSILICSLIFWGCSNEQAVTDELEAPKNIGESQNSKTREINEKASQIPGSVSQKQATQNQQAQNQQTQQKQPNQQTPPNMTTSTLDTSDLSFVEKYSGAILHTTQGDIELSFFGEKSPVTVNNFLKLSAENFYEGVRFHRIIKDFMIQGGDPKSKDIALRSQWGTGGPDYSFPDEINDEKLVAGSLAMANSGPNTNGSQFFIVTRDETPHLDGKHTNFGKVVSGMDVVEKIEVMETNAQDQPLEDVIISSVELIEK